MGREALEIFYAIPDRYRGRLRWVLSVDAIKQIATECGVDEPDEGWSTVATLAGRPIRQDDTTEWLGWELHP